MSKRDIYEIKKEEAATAVKLLKFLQDGSLPEKPVSPSSFKILKDGFNKVCYKLKKEDEGPAWSRFLRRVVQHYYRDRASCPLDPYISKAEMNS